MVEPSSQARGWRARAGCPWSIETDDGARVLFHITGYSRPIEGSPNLRAIVSPATFETDDDRYRWLNNVIAVGEGVIDFETLRLRLRYYGCVEEVSSHPGEWA